MSIEEKESHHEMGPMSVLMSCIWRSKWIKSGDSTCKNHVKNVKTWDVSNHVKNWVNYL